MHTFKLPRFGPPRTVPSVGSTLLLYQQIRLFMHMLRKICKRKAITTSLNIYSKQTGGRAACLPNENNPASLSALVYKL